MKDLSEVDSQTRAAVALDLLKLIGETLDMLRPQTVEEARAVLRGMELAAEDVLKNE
jgi:hypothetical protein